MRELAVEYEEKHKNGYVTKLTDYSFTFTLYPKTKDEKVQSYVVMRSYFWKPQRNK